MFKQIIALLALSLAAGAATANACSYDPQLEQNKQDLIRVAAKKLGVSGVALAGARIAVAPYEFRETISTPMCPKEVGYFGTVSITWAPGGFGAPCHGKVSVSKYSNWEKDTVRYRTRVVTPTVCALH